MGSSMKTTGVARGMSRSCIALLLFTCSLATQNLGAETGAQHSEYCSGSWRLGGWFRLEGRLRHSCEGWLQRQHRSRAGDVV